MSPKTEEQNSIIRNESRKAILDAALHVFAEDSYHGASVSKIAKKAGVSKGLMYNYFKSKEELLKTLMFEIADKFIERMHIPENGNLTDDDVIYFIDVSFEMILEDIQLSKLFFSVYTQQDVMALITEKMMERVIPFISVMTDYFKKKGHEDPAAIMRYFNACIDGIQMHIIMDPTFPIEPVKKLLIKQFVK